MKATEGTKTKAKELGIKSWHIKSEEKLQDEIAAMTGTITEDTAETVVIPEPVKPVPEKVEEKKPELIDLMAGYTWDQALMKIKMNGKKSKFFPFREIIESKLK
jgi:hypothetical protein